MSDDVVDQRLMGVLFVVYSPPAPGLPWLSVCLGPDGKLLSVQTCTTAEEAEKARSECTEVFARKLKGELATIPDKITSVH